MPLYGNREFASGNQKPQYANTGNIYGISTGEKSNTGGQGIGPKLTHSGWVEVRKGTGGIAAITINNAGIGYNGSGFLIFTGGNGSGANAAFTANALNANSIVTVTLNAAGAGYNAAPTATANLGNTVAATFNITMGGRFGRISHEVLVASGSISGDVDDASGFFTGN